MYKATKIRLYPNKSQEQKLAQDFGNARKVWNLALDLKQKAYASGESLSCYDIKKMLPAWKGGEYNYLKQTHSQVLQESILHLDRAYKNAFARVKQGKRATSKRTKKGRGYRLVVLAARFLVWVCPPRWDQKCLQARKWIESIRPPKKLPERSKSLVL